MLYTRQGRTGIPIDTKVVIRGGGEHSIPRARGSHLERDIVVARGNEEVLRVRGPYHSMLMNVKKKKGLEFCNLL